MEDKKLSLKLVNILSTWGGGVLILSHKINLTKKEIKHRKVVY